MDLGPTELIIILVIVVILFGGGRVAKIGGELGSAVANFRKGLQSPETWKGEPSPENKPAEEPTPGKELS
ncbi:MAG: twin-arginine translocase TatA/TatE family subunit [Chloroflexota bacterium]